MTIAQITDLHLPLPSQAGYSESGFSSFDQGFSLLVQALDAIASKNVDLIAVTGDLLDIQESESANAQAGKRYERETESVMIYKKIKAETHARFKNALFIPGNHDHERAFAQVFRDTPRELGIAGFDCISFWDREQTDHIPERLGGERKRFLHTLHSGPPNQVHIQHFPLQPVDNSAYPYNYHDHAALCQAVTESYKVILCLSGHFHPGTYFEKTGSTYFSVCPAFCETPHPLRVYIFNGTSVKVDNFSA